MNILLMLVLVFSGVAKAAVLRGKVVLMTSLIDTVQISEAKNAELEMKMEEKFRRNYEASGYDLEIFHRTTPVTLWSTLSDPQVVGIIWVSHAKKTTAISTGLQDPATVRDAWGNDVGDFFKKTTANLKFLGLVGCEARAMLEQNKTEGLYSEKLVIDAYSKKVDAMSGFKKTLANAHASLLTNDERDIEIKPVETTNSYAFKFQNLASQRGSVLKFEIGGQILSVQEVRDPQIEVLMKREDWSKLKTGNVTISLLGEGKLAPITILVNGQKLWKLFQKDGKAIGGNKNLYLFTL